MVINEKHTITLKNKWKQKLVFNKKCYLFLLKNVFNHN